MNEEIKNALESLKNDIKGKTNEEVKSAIAEFESKYNDALANEVKSVKDEFAGEIKKLTEETARLQVKLEESAKKDRESKDVLKSLITENHEEIKTARKGKSVKVESKAVGDMTLTANLTGDQPRDYSFDTVMIPGQRINVSDLASVLNIGGGTYTFPIESGSEGSISAQTEGSDKSQKDYDLTMQDVNTDFIAGYARYSKKMANNLPFLEAFLPRALRRDYIIAENTSFNAVLAAGVTQSTTNTGDNKVERLIDEIAIQQAANYDVNGIVVRTADYYDMLQIEKSSGAGYGWPVGVTFEGNQLRILGIPVYPVNWIAEANHYYVGDWSRVRKVVTEGLGLEFFEQDGDNVVKNNITARIEAQVALAIEQPLAIRYGDFTQA